jgi:hypothetical protein
MVASLPSHSRPVSPVKRRAIRGQPCYDPVRKGHVVVEAAQRVSTTDRRVVVDVAMVLDESRVEAVAVVEFRRSVFTNVHAAILSLTNSDAAGSVRRV